MIRYRIGGFGPISSDDGVAGQLKRCAACGLRLPDQAFNRDRSKPSGLRSYCRWCDRRRAAAYRAANLEAERARQRAYKRRKLGCVPRQRKVEAETCLPGVAEL